MDADTIDSGQITSEYTKALNTSFSHLSKIAGFRFNLFIYKLVKKGLLSKADIAREAGIDETTIYKIVDQVEKELALHEKKT